MENLSEKKMKLKVTTYILLGVVATSFANEDHKTHYHHGTKHDHAHRRAHHIQGESLKHHQKQGESLKHHHPKFGSRINEKDPVGLEFYADGPSTLVALVNTTSHVAVIFDFSCNIVLVVNGESGNGFAIDGNRHVLLKLEKVWNKEQQPFEQFFQSIRNNNIKKVVQNGKPSTDPADLHEINRIADQLGVESNSAVALLAALKILNQNRLVLKIILKNQRFEVHGDILRIVVVLKGISDVLKAHPEALAGVNLDLASIINAPNGLQAFLRLLQNLRNLDMGKVFGQFFQSLECSLRVVVELRSYKAENGIDNIFRIIYNIYMLVTGRGCVDDLIRTLMEAGQNGGVEVMGPDIQDVIDELLKLAQSQGSRYGNSRLFDVFIRFLRELNQDNLFMSGINVSRFLVYLRRGDYRGAIDMIVNMLFKMNKVVNPAMSVPRFFGILLSLFGDPKGCGPLGQLVPGLDPKQVEQLQKENITKLAHNREAFLSNPVLKKLYDEVSRSANDHSNGSFDPSNLINPGIFPGIGGLGGFPNFLSSLGQTFGGGFGFLNAFQGLGSGFANANPLNFLSQIPFFGGFGGGGGNSSGLGLGNLGGLVGNTASPGPINVINVVKNCSESTTSQTTISAGTAASSEPVTTLNPTTETQSEAELKRKNRKGHAHKESKLQKVLYGKGQGQEKHKHEGVEKHNSRKHEAKEKHNVHNKHEAKAKHYRHEHQEKQHHTNEKH